MGNVLRIVTVERGLDPRDFTLVAFGGGGPLHACAVARELGVGRIVVPPYPGLFSAFGLLEAKLHVNELRPVLRSLQAVDTAALDEDFAVMERRARATLADQGAQESGMHFKRECDARYRGQSFELPIEYDRLPGLLRQRFDAAHRARYGYDVPEEEIEIVNARVTGYGTVPGARRERAAPDSEETVRRGERDVWTGAAYERIEILTRSAVPQGERRDGPLVIEEYDSTTYVAPGWAIRRDGDLLIAEGTAP